MSETRKVRELMVQISEYPRVYETDTLKEAIKVLTNYLKEGKKQHSVIVFSKTKKVGTEEQLLGILTVRDILKTIERNINIKGKKEMPQSSWVYFYRRDPINEYIVTTIGQALRPLVKAFIQADDDAEKAIKLMMTKNINILPVFEGERAVGVIRSIDILDYIGEMV